VVWEGKGGGGGGKGEKIRKDSFDAGRVGDYMYVKETHTYLCECICIAYT